MDFDPIGLTLLHYRITGKIGEGGMGTVYQAVDSHLDRPVALKILPADKVTDPERRGRFVQEAKAASALRHPNIVVIHDIASDQGRDFIVMELVEGQPLDVLIGRRGLKLGEALGYAVQIADGLAKAHAAGIVHRDLKPTNVMVTPEGQVKILDFGLAKLVEEAPAAEPGRTMTVGQEDRPRTEEGYVVGTAAYMSPEQAEGKKVDARSDIFSFGAVLYEMLTGRRAFGRESRIKTLAAVLNEEPKPPTALNETLPAEVERVLVRCLRKDPQRRWQTMSDLKVALQDLKEDSESGKLAAAASLGPQKKRGPWIIAVAGALIVLAAAVAALKLISPGPKGPIEYEIIPVTYDSGMSATPTASAGGGLLAYASDREGNGNVGLWVQQVSGGKPLRLTDHPSDEWLPSLSPDGSQIAFGSDRDGGGVYIIEALAVGGQPRRIADRGGLPKFSPDGRWILYLDIPASLELGQYGVYLVSPKGGEPRRILDQFLLGFIPQGASPVWSPDGRDLLFRGRRVDDPKSVDWWMVPIDGGEPVRTHAIENLSLKTIVQYPVAWVGHSVYYASGTTIEGVNLFRAAIDPKTRAITGPAEAITTGPGMKLYPTVLPDGRIFFSEMTVAMNAWSMPAKSDEGTVTLRPQKLTQDLMQNFEPTISRDGRKAAYNAFGGAQALRIEIRVQDLRDGTEMKIPVQGLSVNQAQRLSPDGSLLAYRDIIEGRAKTFLIAPGAGPAREFCDGCFVPGLFPGNKAALVRNKPGELEKVDLGTGARQVILSSASDIIEDAGLSPDGRWIGWLAGEPDGRAAIRISPVEPRPERARGPITIAESDRYLSQPAWSPNGRWLYYLSEKSGRAALFAQELDLRTQVPVGPEREIFASTESRLWLNFPRGNGAISVAGDRIVFEATRMTGNIFLAKPKTR